MTSLRPHSLIASTGQYRQDCMEFIYLYLPYLPVQRVVSECQLDTDALVCLYQPQKGVDRLVYLSETAQNAGLLPGLSVPDARARQPDIFFYQLDRQHDNHLLDKLARWAGRYTPQRGCDYDGLGIWLDMTGASHLYGGCSAVLKQIVAECRQAGLVVRGAAAPSYGAAWALAHFHNDADNGISALGDREMRQKMLGGLPVAALRLSAGASVGLLHSGLRLVSDLYPLRSADLTMRFGPELRLRLDQLLGRQSETLAPLREVKPLVVSRQFAEPVLGYEALQQLVAQMIADMAEMLMTAEKQARSFTLGWQRLDGSLGQLDFTLSRPSQDHQIITRLCATAAEQITADFGLDYCWMAAHQLTDSRPVTASLGTDSSRLAEIELDYLIDALAAKLGPDKVQRAVPKSRWQVEQAETRYAVADLQARDCGWQPAQPAELRAPRPVRLLTPPQPVDTLSMLPDHPPRQIRWRRRNWQVLRATGPERVGPAWWDEAYSSDKTRDYFRLELAEGPRIWVYREGLAERGEPMRWYMQGFFA